MTGVIKSRLPSASGFQPVGLDPSSLTLPREKVEKQALAQAPRPARGNCAALGSLGKLILTQVPLATRLVPMRMCTLAEATQLP